MLRKRGGWIKKKETGDEFHYSCFVLFVKYCFNILKYISFIYFLWIFRWGFLAFCSVLGRLAGCKTGRMPVGKWLENGGRAVGEWQEKPASRQERWLETGWIWLDPVGTGRVVAGGSGGG